MIRRMPSLSSEAPELLQGKATIDPNCQDFRGSQTLYWLPCPISGMTMLRRAKLNIRATSSVVGHAWMGLCCEEGKYVRLVCFSCHDPLYFLSVLLFACRL